MSKKLKIRKLYRSKLPRQKFKYLVKLKFNRSSAFYSTGNGKIAEEMRPSLRDICQNDFRFVWTKNSKGKRVYTHLQLCNAMDLAMIKLTFSEHFAKIYEVVVTSTGE